MYILVKLKESCDYQFYMKIYLVYSNVSFDLIKQTNSELGIELLVQPQNVVKSNVAIASAITAYARIEMMTICN